MSRHALSADRSHALTILRASAILFIAGYWHLLDYADVPFGHKNALTIRLTLLALGVFTFSSGYLLFPKALSLSPGAFYLKRLLRVYPLLVAAATCFLLLGIESGGTLSRAMFLTSPYVPPEPLTLWYVVILMHCYLLAPLVARYCATPLSCIAAVAAYAGSHEMLSLAGVVVDTRLTAYFGIFAWGMLVRAKGWDHAVASWIWWIAAACATVLAFTVRGTDALGFLLSLPMASVLPIALMTVIKGPVGAGLSRILSPVAYAMFAVYLFHRPVYDLLDAAYSPASVVGQAAYLWAVCLPSVIIAGYVIQRVYDVLIGVPRR